MANGEIEIGVVSIVPFGTYSSAVTYPRLAVVNYNGESYLAKVGNRGQTPSATSEYWLKLVDKPDASKIGSKLQVTMDSSTYVITYKLLNMANEVISTQTIDLPLESVVVNAEYNNVTKNIVLTLQNGNQVSFSVSDLISGLVSETDLNTAVNTLENEINQKANSADVYKKEDVYNKSEIDDKLQNLNQYELNTNKVNTIDDSEEHYPSSKAVKDYIDSLNAEEVSY